LANELPFGLKTKIACISFEMPNDNSTYWEWKGKMKEAKKMKQKIRIIK
jgi:uncharacterized protein involved in tolerance to divalent cations